VWAACVVLHEALSGERLFPKADTRTGTHTHAYTPLSLKLFLFSFDALPLHLTLKWPFTSPSPSLLMWNITKTTSLVLSSVLHPDNFLSPCSLWTLSL
jgi:hypothetical protein